jgi:hypothetical protein
MIKDMMEIAHEEDAFDGGTKWVGYGVWEGYPPSFGSGFHDTKESCQNAIDDFHVRAQAALKNNKNVVVTCRDGIKRPYKNLILTFPYPVKT